MFSNSGQHELDTSPPFLPDLLFLIALGANLLVVLGARHFPYHDAVNHLARWSLMSDAWAGRGAEWARIELGVFPSPYLGFDLLGAALVRLAGPAHALRAMTALAVTSVPAGMYCLLRAVAPAQRGWALIGVLFGLGFFTMLGSLAEVLGLGLSLAWLAYWWPRRAHPSVGGVSLLAFGCLALYLVHLTAPLSILVVLWIDYGVSVLARLKEATSWKRKLQDTRLFTAVPVTLFVGVLVVAWMATSIDGQARDPFHWPAAADKARNLLSPFYSLSFTQLGVMAGGYAASVVAFLLSNRLPRRWDTFAVASLAFLVLYLVFPFALGAHTAMLDVRWLLPAYLLPFCVAMLPRGRTTSAALVVPFVAALAHAAVIGGHARDIDRKLDDYDVLLADIPPGATILPIDADPGRHRRVLPYHFYSMWHTVHRHGRVTGMFAFQTDLGTYENMRALRVEGTPLHRVPDYWAIGGRFEYDWPTLNRQYDYIILAGNDPVAASYLSSHARELRRVGEITLYETVGGARLTASRTSGQDRPDAVAR